jgi:hypothetical protein
MANTNERPVTVGLQYEAPKDKDLEQKRTEQDRKLGELAERATNLSRRARGSGVVINPATGEIFVGREADEDRGIEVSPEEMYKK